MANEEILELQISDNSSIAAQGLDKLSTSLDRLKAAIGKGMNLKGTVSGLEKLKNAVNVGLNEDSVARFERLADTLERLKAIGGLKIAGIKNIANQLNVADSLSEAKEAVQDTTNEVAGAIDLGMKEVENRSNQAASSFSSVWGDVKSHLHDVWGRIADVKDAANEKGSTGFFDSLKDGIKGLREQTSGLLGDFARIVKYRMIRSIIKQITKGVSEGIKNMYFYSKAIGGEFASSMNDAASSLLQFKNSIGAAAAPLIQSLIPFLKEVINYAIQAVNYINQFLALLRGQSTWTKALYKATDAFEDTKKKAKGAGKSIKDLLADFDELNIIQSETGGSGGAGKAAEDYTKMFEETDKFDNALKDHFDTILDVVSKIGLALGAWKFSKLFTGFLGKLFKLAAGGLMVSVGLELSYGAGFDIGLNGLNAKNALQGILGTLATGLGGSLITAGLGLGGGVGFAIGVGVAIVTTLIGYIKGQESLRDKNKWGNLEWTREQIESFVKSQFSFPVESDITVLDGEIKNRETAINNLNEKIDEFKKSLTDANVQASINIESDDTNGAITAAAGSARDAIKAVEDMLKDSDEGLNVILKNFTFQNADGEDITKDLLKSVKIDNQTLSSYFKGIGDELASLIEQGEHEHWQNADTKQAALDLMERERKILDEAKALSADMQLDIEIQSGFDKGISRDTALDIMNEQKAALEEYKTAAEEAIKGQANEYAYLAGLAEAASRDAFEHGDSTNGEELHAAAERYKNRATELLSGMETAIDTKLAETKKTMAEKWSETLKTVYGEDFNKSISGREFTNFIEGLTSLSMRGDTATASKEIREKLVQMLGGDDPNGIVKYVLGDLEGSLFSLFSDEMRKSLYKTILSETNNDYDAASEILQGIFGMTEAEVKEAFKDEFAIRPRKGWKGEWKQPEEDPNAWMEGVIEDEYLDLDHPLEEDVPIVINPIPEVEGIDEYERELRDAITEALSDEVFSFDERTALDWMYGADEVEKVLQKMKEEGMNADGTFGKILNSTRGLFTGGNGVSSGYINGAQGETNEDLAEKVTVGVKGANEPQNELLRSMIGYLSTIASKDTVVNFSLAPNSDWGRHNTESNDAYSKMTGTVNG